MYHFFFVVYLRKINYIMGLLETARNAWTTIKNETVRRANTATRVGNAGLAIIDYVESLDTTLTDDLALKMQYKGDYDIIPYANYNINDVYTWRGNLYLVNTLFSTIPTSPPEDFHNPDDTNYWTPLTKNINKTVTTANQLNDTSYADADNMVLLLDDRLGGLTSTLPSTHNDLSICRMEIGKTLGVGGMQFLQKVVDVWGTEWQRYTTWDGSDYVWGYWNNVLEHVHVLNDLTDVDTTQSKTAPIDSDKLLIWDSVTNNWKSVLKADLNEIYVGTGLPSHNEVLMIDNTADLLVYKSATTATITPNNTLKVDKYNSNYAGGNTVLVDYPTFDTGKQVDYDDDRVVVIKNIKAGTVTFIIQTGLNTVGGIEYNYLAQNDDTFDLDQDNYAEISYLYTMTSATTCDVLIRIAT